MYYFGIILVLNTPLHYACNSNRYIYKYSSTRIWSYRQPTITSDCYCDDDIFIKQHHLQLIEHVEGDILNFELYNDMLPPALVKIVRNLPKVLRVIKPVAKAGIRTYGAPATPEMRRIIAEKFPLVVSTAIQESNDTMTNGNSNSNSSEEEEGEATDVKDIAMIGVFVYMFVQESFRGSRWGESLLQLAYRECRRKGYRYMLLVHDDNGSGKLIRYYEARGFQSIQSFLPKGMIRQLD